MDAMRNRYVLIILLLFVSALSISPLYASEKISYKTTGYAVVWYFSGEADPTMIPVGYTGQPIYISDVSQPQQNDVFAVLFKPFNQTTGVFSPSTPFVTVGTFKLNNQSSYTIPASYFQNAGQYRIEDTQWINPMNTTAFLLFNSSITPEVYANAGPGQQLTLIWIVLLALVVLIVVLFASLIRIMRKMNRRKRR